MAFGSALMRWRQGPLLLGSTGFNQLMRTWKWHDVGTNHADVVAIQQELGELDLSTGVITADILVQNRYKDYPWSF